MNSRIHLIITGERGRTRAFAFSRRKLRATLFLFLAAVAVLSILSGAGLVYRKQNERLAGRVVKLETNLLASITDSRDFRETVEERARAAEALEREKEASFSEALQDLREKNRAVESILKVVGLEVETGRDDGHSGGPFVELPDESMEDLAFRVENNLSLLRYVPLGSPVPGPVVSRYGRRLDPLNRKPAFHDGVDIRSDLGTEIVAPADGTVFDRGYTRGNGNYLVIDHGQRFRTTFLHLKKALVKRGARVKRGERIALLGNTGRSTGAHLHYGVYRDGRTVDPLRYIRVSRFMGEAGKTK